MRNLIRYVIKHHAFLLFIVLEVVSLLLVFEYNIYQKSKFFNSANRVTGYVYNSYTAVVSYFGLKEVNRKLSEENARLRTLLLNRNVSGLPEVAAINVLPPGDSMYHFISARVINNSVNRQNNYITLNKGRKHGIRPDQGIINSDGVVGIITHVTDSYSMGFSVLNKRWGVSAKLKKSGTFGPISWNGKDFRYVNLEGIPFHIELAKGDTVVTSSYSSVFPEGILIGTVESFEKPAGENYYVIVVKLATDFKSLSYVEVVDNLKRKEIMELERNKTGNENSD